VFGSRVGFSGSAHRMALFRVGTNSIGMCEKTMCDEKLDWSLSKVFLVNGHTSQPYNKTDKRSLYNNCRLTSSEATRPILLNFCLFALHSLFAIYTVYTTWLGSVVVRASDF